MTEDWDNPKTGQSSELAKLIGIQSADRIRASGHARRVKQAGHMSAPVRAVISIIFPLRGGGRSLIAPPLSIASLLFSVAVPGSRFSPRSEVSAATSGPKHRRCNVHNGLAWYSMWPKALLRSRLHPRPVGQPSHPRRRRSGWDLGAGLVRPPLTAWTSGMARLSARCCA